MADTVVRIDPLVPSSAVLPPGLSLNVVGPGEFQIVWNVQWGRLDRDYAVRWTAPHSPVRFAGAVASGECVICTPTASDAEIAAARVVEPEVIGYSG